MLEIGLYYTLLQSKLTLTLKASELGAQVR